MISVDMSDAQYRAYLELIAAEEDLAERLAILDRPSNGPELIALFDFRDAVRSDVRNRMTVEHLRAEVGT